MAADVHRVHPETLRRHPGTQQGHGDGIGFLAGGTGDRQDAQRAARVLGLPGLTHPTCQRGERRAITEEPTLRYDDGFDEFIQFVGGRDQTLEVGFGGRRTNVRHADAHGALHRRGANGRGIQTHGTTQEFLHVSHHGRLSSRAGAKTVRMGPDSKDSSRTRWMNPVASAVTGPR